MNPYRQLASAAYVVAAVLIAYPLVDSAVSVMPWHVGSAQWRFGAVGLLSNTLMIVALGAFIAVGTAVSLKQDRTRRLLGFVSWTCAGLLFVTSAAFALDALQSRGGIRSDMLISYQLASMTAEIKLLVGVVSFVLFARGCRGQAPKRRESAALPPLISARQAN